MSGKKYTYMWKQPSLPLNGSTWKWSPNGVKNLFFTNRYPVPIWSAPYTNTSYLQENSDLPNGASFKARPIRHWRKQVEPRMNKVTGRSGIRMQMEKPGAEPASLVNKNRLFSEYDCDNVKSYFLNEYVLRDTLHEINLQRIKFVTSPKFINRDKYNPQLIDRSNPKPVCSACNPEANTIRGAVNINNQDYSFDTSSYLSSRCKTYEKNIMGVEYPGTITKDPTSGKITWPDDSDYGPQNRLAKNCHRSILNNIKEYEEFPPGFRCSYKIIYKPNNIKFAQQGGVSSSSRIQRLRYDRLTDNGVQYKSSNGAKATNDGLFLFDAMSQYFIKTKYEAFKHNRKQGNHSNCFFTPTGSVGGKAPVIPPPPVPDPGKVLPTKTYSCYPPDSALAGSCKEDPQGPYTIDECSRCSKTISNCSKCPKDSPCFDPRTGTCSLPIDEQGNCAGQGAGIINCNNQGKTPCDICNDPNFPCFNEASGTCSAEVSPGYCAGQGAGVINCNNQGKKPCEICNTPELPCYNEASKQCIPAVNNVCPAGTDSCIENRCICDGNDVRVVWKTDTVVRDIGCEPPSTSIFVNQICPSCTGEGSYKGYALLNGSCSEIPLVCKDDAGNTVSCTYPFDPVTTVAALKTALTNLPVNTHEVVDHCAESEPCYDQVNNTCQTRSSVGGCSSGLIDTSSKKPCKICESFDGGNKPCTYVKNVGGLDELYRCDAYVSTNGLFGVCGAPQPNQGETLLSCNQGHTETDCTTNFPCYDSTTQNCLKRSSIGGCAAGLKDVGSDVLGQTPCSICNGNPGYGECTYVDATDNSILKRCAPTVGGVCGAPGDPSEVKINCGNQGSKYNCKADGPTPCFDEDTGGCLALSGNVCPGSTIDMRTGVIPVCGECTKSCGYIDAVSHQLYQCSDYVLPESQICPAQYSGLDQGSVLYNCGTNTCYQQSDIGGAIVEVPCPI